MEYALMILVGFVTGGVCVFFGLDRKRRELDRQRSQQNEHVNVINNARRETEVRRAQLESDHMAKVAEIEAMRSRTIEALMKQRDKLLQEFQSRKSEYEARQESALLSIRKRQEDVDQQLQIAQMQMEERRCNAMQSIAEAEQKLESEQREFRQNEAAFKAHVVRYEELRDENTVLKRELQRLSIRGNRLHLDSKTERARNDEIAQKVEELGGRYLKENVKWIGKSLNANNFAACKDRLVTVIERCREIGLSITSQEEQTLVNELRSQYELEVRAALEKEEQARIRAQIREEQKREREIQKELERVENERSILQAALDKALAQAHDQHSAEIERLRERLAEAEARERAVSQAQLTKAGFVYVISNIGSFGEGVFKIGMTRRLEPLDRVRELGDASVPFPFDVHMMVSCEDAPALECALHKNLHKRQINRANPRKEFYRTDIETIATIVRKNHGEVQYVADVEALQYRQSLTMSEDDQEYIEHVFDEYDSEDGAIGEESGD
jgi:hypothetical protein